MSEVTIEIARLASVQLDVIEPYLMQNGFIQRTARGRMLTDLAHQHLGII